MILVGDVKLGIAHRRHDIPQMYERYDLIANIEISTGKAGAAMALPFSLYNNCIVDKMQQMVIVW